MQGFHRGGRRHLQTIGGPFGRMRKVELRQAFDHVCEFDVGLACPCLLGHLLQLSV
jgi:hypothetical protein